MDRAISDFLRKEYKEFAKYVLHHRAIPNIIDGLKPVQRKALWTALKHCQNSYIKTAALVGYILAQSNYHHGDASITAALNLMTQDFVGSNNMSIFQGKGHFGNRLSPEPGAARYTSLKINPRTMNYFKDFDILDKSPDPENPEPLCYLPTIPWLLVNGCRGIAIGYATHILPRKLNNLKKVIKLILEGKKASKKLLAPYFEGFKGRVEHVENCTWRLTGIFTREKKNIIRITEIPIGYTQEKYATHLEKLKVNKLIKSYDDCSKHGFDFRVKLANEMGDEEILNRFNLTSTITENFTVIDNENRLREFEDATQIVKYYIKYRIKKYTQRIQKDLVDTKNAIRLIDDKFRFANILDKVKRCKDKESLVNICKQAGIKFIDEVIGVPVYKYARFELDKLDQEKIKLKEFIKYLQKTDAKVEWIKELEKPSK